MEARISVISVNTKGCAQGEHDKNVDGTCNIADAMRDKMAHTLSFSCL